MGTFTALPMQCILIDMKTTTNHPASPSPTFAAGTCRTCGCPKGAPYRRHVGGEVTEGCIALDHDGHPDAWHMRPAAVRQRADYAAYLAKLLA